MFDITVLEHARLVGTFSYSQNHSGRAKKIRKLLKKQKAKYTEIFGPLGRINTKFCTEHDHDYYVEATRFVQK